MSKDNRWLILDEPCEKCGGNVMKEIDSPKCQCWTCGDTYFLTDEEEV